MATTIRVFCSLKARRLLSYFPLVIPHANGYKSRRANLHEALFQSL